MAEQQATPGFEYRIYGPAYRVAAKVDETGQVQIRCTETVDGEERTTDASGKLSDEAREQVAGLLRRVPMSSWDQKRVTPGTQAAVIASAGGAAWDAEALGEDGRPRELRKWAEANLHLAMHAGDQAKQRAMEAEKDTKDDVAAAAYKAALDRLGDWWLPEGPAFDATENRLVRGEAALRKGDHGLAASVFSQVLEMRLSDYREKYGL